MVSLWKKSMGVLGVCGTCLWLLLLASCGPSLKGVVTLVKAVENTAATLVLRKDNLLYITDENNKLQVYDITNPREPVKKEQVDVFAGPYYGATLYGTRLVLIGADGKMALISLDEPAKPKTPWGRDQFVQLPFKPGPFAINAQAGVMYMTPGEGKALARIDLGKLNLPLLPEASIVTGAIKTYDGSGGGGIQLVLDPTGLPIRLYTGTKDGKINAWLVSDIESGQATAPSSSFACALGGRLQKLFFHAVDNNNTLLAVAEAAEGSPDIEVFDLGRNFTKAGEPTVQGTATVGGLHTFDVVNRIGVNRKLEVWDFTTSFTAPTQYAATELRSFTIRDLLIADKILFAAEVDGFRVHEFADRK